MRVHDEWLLTPQAVAIHLPTQTAVLADLHLGYAESRRAAGDAVPLVPLAEALAPLGQAAAQGARRVVLAGDVVEDGSAAGVADELLIWLAAAGLELVGVVPGNHDEPLQAQAPELPWYPDGCVVGNWLVLHGVGRLPSRSVVHGHFHPAMPLGRHGLLPCYLTTPQRLVLPAYSRDAAGVNILGIPRWRGYRCLVIGGSQVVDLGPLR